MKPPGGECHDLFGADFNGSPSHHRVLKPPGGGTSDIFGPAETVEQQPRKVRQHPTSSLFLGGHEDNPTPSKSKPGNDTFKTLFGEPEPRTPSAVKNRTKSNIFLDDSATTNSSTAHQKISFPYQSSVLRNGTTPAGNPVTGEGYKDKPDGSASSPTPSQPAMNGTSAPTPGRQRVPPGGFSSGLW